MDTVRIAGEPSYRVETESIVFTVARSGGMLGPVVFDLEGRSVQPFAVAPWGGTGEAMGQPPILRALRGDFFCMPFGANTTPFEGEAHPIHGESANLDWRFAASTNKGRDATLELTLEPSHRPGRIRKSLTVHHGHRAIYSEHRLEGFRGPMPLGHHAMLRFPGGEGSGRISVSPFAFGQVFPGEFETPANGGYSCLQPGAQFDSLRQVPRSDGGMADLTHYPAREGFEDLVMVAAPPSDAFAWSAAVLPEEGYLWLGLKNPKSLPSTVLWHSNGGRHYPPWNGRHRHVLGIEEVCAYFHYGLAESASPNPVSERGIATCCRLDPSSPTVIRYVMAIHPIGPETGAVRAVEADGDGLRVAFETGPEALVPLDLGFLAEEPG